MEKSNMCATHSTITPSRSELTVTSASVICSCGCPRSRCLVHLTSNQIDFHFFAKNGIVDTSKSIAYVLFGMLEQKFSLTFLNK